MFLDTSGLLCLLDERDSGHVDAVAYYHLADFMVTHPFVLAELVALGHVRRIHRSKVLTFIDDLFGNPKIAVEAVESSMRLAVDFLRSRIDKSYSLCDAMSFLLMRHFGIMDALTTDRHFQQEGFVRLLAS